MSKSLIGHQVDANDALLASDKLFAKVVNENSLPSPKRGLPLLNGIITWHNRLCRCLKARCEADKGISLLWSSADGDVDGAAQRFGVGAEDFLAAGPDFAPTAAALRISGELSEADRGFALATVPLATRDIAVLALAAGGFDFAVAKGAEPPKAPGGAT
eukprot:CAMPEP_0206605854 /NCGR_PEP_ID=MMETSP0325_2-20121206/50743_1 /ASSEMBLY_ACC=CAM_ASM_000347 /TAXON_ID=2866 /ORGANISM="Crypthecodinium cohnii, Strain Seligo" /LENGTH=158 /DNA_ID=CAMNT_0054121637 /DNA_START=220 /DNA_END=693 /DNA_ORIENTATION=+